MAITGDLMEWGQNWLAANLQQFVSQPVTAWNGEFSVQIRATMGSQILHTTDGLGNTKIERADADFIFPAQSLDFGDGNGVVEPPAGMLIDVVLGGVIKRFQMMPRGQLPAWRYSDPFQQMVRVHTKYIGPAE